MDLPPLVWVAVGYFVYSRRNPAPSAKWAWKSKQSREGRHTSCRAAPHLGHTAAAHGLKTGQLTLVMASAQR